MSYDEEKKYWKKTATNQWSAEGMIVGMKWFDVVEVWAFDFGIVCSLYNVDDGSLVECGSVPDAMDEHFYHDDAMGLELVSVEDSKSVDGT